MATLVVGSEGILLGVPKERILFICTANMSRSPACERLFAGAQKFEARSAGTKGAEYGHTQVSQALIDWADRVFVMSEAEDGHLTYLRENFNLDGKPVHVLGVPNVYDLSEGQQAALYVVLREKLASFFDLTNL